MIVLSGALVLVALVLLVFGAVDRNLPYVYASIGVSVLSLLLLLVGILQRRGELSGEDESEPTTPVTDTSDARVPAFAGASEAPAPAGGTAELPAHAPADGPASRRVDSQPTQPAGAASEPADDDLDGALADDGLDDDGLDDDGLDDDGLDDDGLDDDELDDDGSGVTVLVVSGRPRYHLEGCRVLRGKEPEPLDRDAARTHGFTPCGVCKPDADEAVASEPTGVGDPAPAQKGVSITEALFGEPIFADRPVQPVLPVIEPAPVSAVDDAAEPPALRGDDPADDPAVEVGAHANAAPAPDVAADPDAAPDEQESHTGAAEPVVEPVAADDVATVDDEDSREPAAAEVEQSAGPDTTVLGATAADADVPVGGAPAAPARTRAKQAPEKQAPAKKAAQKKAPAKKAASSKAPAKKAPAKKAPAKKAAAKKAPGKTPVEGSAPVGAAPAPQVKRPVVRAVRADALRLGAPSSGATTTRVSVRAAAPATGSSVVVVPDRDRFHRPECRYVRDVPGATALPQASAARQGYAACGVCKP